MNQLELKINIPDGYEIDEKNSTFECIKFKPKVAYLTMDEVWHGINEDASGFNEDEEICVSDGYSISINSDDKRLAKVAAYAALSDIAEYYNQGWEPDWDNDGEPKYYISPDPYLVKGYDVKTTSIMNDGLICFKEKADAQAVIDNPNFKGILGVLFS